METATVITWQIPLRPIFASTVAGTQGLTMKKAAANTNPMSAAGYSVQSWHEDTYVQLSRCEHEGSLALHSPPETLKELTISCKPFH